MSQVSNTSDDILACARSLIVTSGYNGFSYADIADVVGIRKASIHHHFPSKVDLVRTLVARYREDVEAAIAGEERRGTPPLDLLCGYAAYWQACIADGTRPFCICALLASEMPALPPEVALEVRAYFRSFSAWLASVMERGAAEGTIRLSGTAHAEAETFMATVHGAMLSARAYGDPQAFAAVTQPLIERLSAPHH